MWPRLLSQKRFLIVPFMAMLAGCLSPATLGPVAEYNSKNISNYNSNVAAIANALRREAAFHGELEIQIARNKLASELIQLPKQWLGPPDPTSHDLADPSKDPYKSLQKSVDEAREYRTRISDTHSDEDAIAAAVVAKYPLAADITLETPGFSVIRVLEDTFTLRKLNAKILDETEDEVRAGLMRKRDCLLDPYLSVRIQKDLVQTYLNALEEYMSIVMEQGQVAADHANSIAVYANARPQVSTLASALRDQEIRGELLELVKKKKGEKYCRNIENYLIKADDMIEVITGLSMSK